MPAGSLTRFAIGLLLTLLSLLLAIPAAILGLWGLVCFLGGPNGRWGDSASFLWGGLCCVLSLPLLVLSVVASRRAARLLRLKTGPADPRFCPDCGYDQRGTVGPACPECGRILE